MAECKEQCVSLCVHVCECKAINLPAPSAVPNILFGGGTKFKLATGSSMKIEFKNKQLQANQKISSANHLLSAEVFVFVILVFILK